MKQKMNLTISSDSGKELTEFGRCKATLLHLGQAPPLAEDEEMDHWRNQEFPGGGGVHSKFVFNFVFFSHFPLLKFNTSFCQSWGGGELTPLSPPLLRSCAREMDKKKQETFSDKQKCAGGKPMK